MDILVNGQIKELSIIDPKTGCEWTSDLIGNENGYDGYDDDQEIHTMTPDTYDWWSSYVEAEQKLQDRAHALSAALGNEDREKFNQDMIDAADNDFEMMTAAQTEVVADWENKVNT